MNEDLMRRIYYALHNKYSDISGELNKLDDDWHYPYAFQHKQYIYDQSDKKIRMLNVLFTELDNTKTLFKYIDDDIQISDQLDAMTAIMKDALSMKSALGLNIGKQTKIELKRYFKERYKMVYNHLLRYKLSFVTGEVFGTQARCAVLDGNEDFFLFKPEFFSMKTFGDRNLDELELNHRIYCSLSQLEIPFGAKYDSLNRKQKNTILKVIPNVSNGFNAKASDEFKTKASELKKLLDMLDERNFIGRVTFDDAKRLYNWQTAMKSQIKFSSKLKTENGQRKLTVTTRLRYYSGDQIVFTDTISYPMTFSKNDIRSSFKYYKESVKDRLPNKLLEVNVVMHWFKKTYDQLAVSSNSNKNPMLAEK